MGMKVLGIFLGMIFLWSFVSILWPSLLGIVALVSSLLHWWWAKGSKWMVGWGWLERPARGGPPGNATQIASTLETWLSSQRGFAEELGEKAFYIALLLLVLALVKYFPYRLFIKTHKWLALAYLALVYHTVVLTKMAYWSQPIGWVLALMLLAGTVSSLLVLFKRVGKNRQVSGTVAQVAYIPELKVTRTDIRLTPGWKGHRSGQFAFVSAFSDERAHPYTLSSAWDPKNPMVQFITKALGDHTSTLHERLKPGMPVTVEGPYGCFTFDDTPPRQIWVGGGIGITPLLAMAELQFAAGARQVLVIYEGLTCWAVPAMWRDLLATSSAFLPMCCRLLCIELIKRFRLAPIWLSSSWPLSGTRMRKSRSRST